MALEFIEKDHRYLLDGEEIPSVSEIIRFAEREVYKEPSKFQMDQAADRGRRVHKACEELDKTGACECDGDIAGYVKAYAKFKAEHDVSWMYIEEPVIGLKNRYAGTLDRAGRMDNKNVILDIKTTGTITGKHKILYKLQLTMYGAARIAATDLYLPDDSEYYVLQLKDDGTYKLISLEGDSTLAVCCLLLHEEFEKTKRRKKNGRERGSKGSSRNSRKE